MPSTNVVTKYLHAPLWYPNQPLHCLQNTDSKGVTLKWISTLLSSIHQSIAPVNWYEFLQTMAFKATFDSANSCDLLSLSWSCQNTRSKELLWKRLYGWCACSLPLGRLSTPVNSRKEFIGERWDPGRKLSICQMGLFIYITLVDESLAVLLLHYCGLSTLFCAVCQLIFVGFDHVCNGGQRTFFNMVCLVALR